MCGADAGGDLLTVAAQGCDEAVATTRKCLQVAWLCGIVSECRAYLFDTKIDTLIEIDERVIAPNLLLDVGTGDHFAWTIDEESEDFERLRL